MCKLKKSLLLALQAWLSLDEEKAKNKSSDWLRNATAQLYNVTFSLGAVMWSCVYSSSAGLYKP